MNNSYVRRSFVKDVLKLGGGAFLLTVPGISIASPKTYTVQDIIDLILKEIPGAPFSQTVDTLKSGKGSQVVTGIISTMFATVDIIQQAVKMKANFIIVHEPGFYNHTDDSKWVEKNEILEQKQALLEKHQIAVWRFHDYWHSHRPDGILTGVAKSMNWEKNYTPGEPLFTIPPTSLDNLQQQFKKNLGIKHLRVIGDLKQTCKTLVLLPGASGGQRHISMVEKYHPDLLVVGELHEWETAEYIRDSRSLGRNISLIVLGHAVSEEPGMVWFADWLKPKLEGVAITHIPTPDPFTWL
jgi:putative NIF3 family GTP cyclohydrolase 1 type 2